MPFSVEVRRHGTLSDGTEVRLFTLISPDGVRVSVSEYGATVVAFEVPVEVDTDPYFDRGEYCDIVLGFDTLEEYETQNSPYFGSTVGRVAGRIYNASFSLDGATIDLVKNDNERHHLHGGTRGFNAVVWSGDVVPAAGFSSADSSATLGGSRGYPYESATTPVTGLSGYSTVATTAVDTPDTTATGSGASNGSGYGSGEPVESSTDKKTASSSSATGTTTGSSATSDRSSPMPLLDSIEFAEAVTFEHESPAGDEGYPGTVRIRSTFRILPGNELEISYWAKTDAPTPLAPTSHSYFNLSGRPDRDGGVRGHELWLDSGCFLAMGGDLVPTGDLVKVKGSDVDFRHGRIIGDVLEVLPTGVDHVFVVDMNAFETDETVTPTPAKKRDFLSDDASEGELSSFVASLTSPEGRTVDVRTTEPTLVVYTGNFLDGSIEGKNGVAYTRHAGVCLEAQQPPNAVNVDAFPDVILRPGEIYSAVTAYSVSWDRGDEPSLRLG